MNAILETTLKTLSCGAAAAAITVLMALSCVESTASVPSVGRSATPGLAKLSVQPRHVLFGQPEPAVLVD